MKKFISLSFSILLVLLLVLTVAFGVREIGKAVYKSLRSFNINSLFDSIDKLTSDTENAFNTNFVLKSACVDIFGLIKRAENVTVIEDTDPTKTVLKGDNGKLYFRGEVTSTDAGTDDSDLETIVNSVIELKSFCEDNNVNLLYVTAPSKYEPGTVILPEPKFVNTELYDKLSELLTGNGVELLDLSAKMKNRFSDYSDGFFITDHHWNVKTAFWGFQEICQALNERFNLQIDPLLFDEGSYSVTTEKGFYLGSMGVRTGRFYSALDDVDLIEPKFDTDFSVDFNTKTLGNSVNREGSFKKAIIDDSNGYSYNMYITSDHNLIHIDNKTVKNGRKVLLIKDSFAIPVSAWLACCADELFIMDLRYDQECSVEDFVLQNGIDVVVILYNREALFSPRMHTFNDIVNQ